MNLQKIVSVLFIFIISGFYSQNNWFSDLIPNTYHSHPEFGASDENWHVDNIELIQYRRENAKTFIDINYIKSIFLEIKNLIYFIKSESNPLLSLISFRAFDFENNFFL